MKKLALRLVRMMKVMRVMSTKLVCVLLCSSGMGSVVHVLLVFGTLGQEF
jgi:hypothetical protein